MTTQNPTENPNKSDRDSITPACLIQAKHTPKSVNGSDIIQTPTQIATESMRGCGAFIRMDYRVRVICSSFATWKCPTCKKVNQTHKQDWEGELEYLKDKVTWHNDECDSCLVNQRVDEMKMEELTQALKILEGGK